MAMTKKAKAKKAGRLASAATKKGALAKKSVPAKKSALAKKSAPAKKSAAAKKGMSAKRSAPARKVGKKSVAAMKAAGGRAAPPGRGSATSKVAAKTAKRAAKAKPAAPAKKAIGALGAAKAKGRGPAKAPERRRRDALGHLDPAYEADLLSKSDRHKDDDTAFLGGKLRSSDDLAEELGEQFVGAATSGEDVREDSLNEVVPEERGGPFVPSTAGTEFAEGTDASNPADAKREPFPRT